MIMDTFAALALASERPHPSIIKSAPVREKEPLLTPSMWKHIYGMTVYVFTVSTLMYFFIDNMWGIEYDQSDEFYQKNPVLGKDGKPTFDEDLDQIFKYSPTSKCEVYTMIFNLFVWMHIFNEFNCRKIAVNQYNIFDGLITNWIFSVVMIIIIVLQLFFTQYAGSAM